MSGLREIIEWVEDEWLFDPEDSVQEEYAAISEKFESDNRSTLDHILGIDKNRFLQYIADRKTRPPTVEEALEREPRLEDIESEPDIISRVSKDRKEKGIIVKVIGFLKGLFR